MRKLGLYVEAGPGKAYCELFIPRDMLSNVQIESHTIDKKMKAEWMKIFSVCFTQSEKLSVVETSREIKKLEDEILATTPGKVKTKDDDSESQDDLNSPIVVQMVRSDPGEGMKVWRDSLPSPTLVTYLTGLDKTVLNMVHLLNKLMKKK